MHSHQRQTLTGSADIAEPVREENPSGLAKLVNNNVENIRSEELRTKFWSTSAETTIPRSLVTFYPREGHNSEHELPIEMEINFIM